MANPPFLRTFRASQANSPAGPNRNHVPASPGSSGTAVPHIYKQLDRVPTLRLTALRLMNLMVREDSSNAEWKQILMTDPAFATAVLRVANAAGMATRSEVTSIEQALFLIGRNKLQQVVLTVALRGLLPGQVDSRALRACWRHSLASALWCRELSNRRDRTQAASPDWWYLAGLLHDTGRMALIGLFPKEYDLLLEAQPTSGETIDTLEKQRFGTNNLDAGLYLLQRWNLPKALLSLMRPDSPGETDDCVLRDACLAADWMGFRVSLDETVEPIEQLQARLSPLSARCVGDLRLFDAVAQEVNAIECGLLM